jgi:glutamate-1-semialdehyde 2,1-aminomutase
MSFQFSHGTFRLMRTRLMRRSPLTIFTTGPAPRNYRDAAACDRDLALAFHEALQEEGIRINQAGKWFLSTAHDDAIIDETLAAADRAMATLR